MALVLLDTDILSELIKLRNSIVRQHALSYTRQVGPIAFSEMTRYEVLRGYKQQNATTQLFRFASFCQHSQIFQIDSAIEREGLRPLGIRQVDWPSAPRCRLDHCRHRTVPWTNLGNWKSAALWLDSRIDRFILANALSNPHVRDERHVDSSYSHT